MIKGSVSYYWTPDKRVLVKNTKGKTILDIIYPSGGNMFRIPSQTIRTKNKLRLVAKIPVNSKLLDKFLELYPPERKYDPSSVKISRGDHESSKACIYPGLGRIFYNKQFLDSIPDLTARKQVMFHELGHIYYQSEWKCDLFAATVLYMLGYPKEAIIQAVERTLDYNPQNVARLHQLINYLSKLEPHGNF